MGEPDLAVGRVGQSPGQDRAEGGAHRQHGGGHDVVAHGGTEAGGQGPPHLPHQGHAVPADRGGDPQGSCDRDGPDVGEHAGHHEQRAAVEQQQPCRLQPPVTGLGRGVQQGVGEVPAPHHDRVAHRPEQEQVDHQPPRSRDERVHQGDHPGGHQPQDHRQVAQRPETAGGLPAHDRLLTTGLLNTGLLTRAAHAGLRVPRNAHPTAMATNDSTATMLRTPPVTQAPWLPRASPTHSRNAKEPCRSTAGAMRAGW